MPGTAGNSECGLGGCAVGYRLVGRPGEPADQVGRRMWDHLTKQGWPSPDNGLSCRPVGWLLDTRQTCVLISTADEEAQLTPAGVRALQRHDTMP